MKKLYFIGIVFEKKISSRIQSLKEMARTRFASRKALRSPAHITLAAPFHYDAKQIQQVKTVVEEMESAAFPIRLEGAGRFGKRVIFVKTDSHKELSSYRDRLEEKLQPLGIDTRTRKFHPHVTIAFKDLQEKVFPEAYTYFSDKCDIGISYHWKPVILELYPYGWKSLQ
jgi:2'-5' RNA ligase